VAKAQEGRGAPPPAPAGPTANAKKYAWPAKPAVLSTRVKGFYVAGVFHHLSRHLADRAKRPPVDWNMFGGRVGANDRRAYGAERAVHVGVRIGGDDK